MKSRTRLLSPPLLLLLAGWMAAPAGAAPPTVSVPSTPDPGGQIVIKGSDLPAYSTVTVRFSAAALAAIDSVAQVKADGSFAVAFRPPVPASYQVKVYDSAGREIGQGNFGFIR